MTSSTKTLKQMYSVDSQSPINAYAVAARSDKNLQGQSLNSNSVETMNLVQPFPQNQINAAEFSQYMASTQEAMQAY